MNGGVAQAFAASQVYLFEYSITRVSETLLDLSFTASGGSIANFSALRSSVAYRADSYDTLGIFVHAANQADDFTIDNVIVQVIPEPRTYGLVAGALVLLAVTLRRRRK